ncbi:hypothetical protein [Paraliomyxa miuraensis]|uniref:hypothetical protein n=1 Tax=Paraliomyxa miuraensis TaxID=376150 RepID=UPI00225958AD|nr:hypothetical protein [Paraliomyxa miuraensis]MCX4242687.1 hypothetical protein [Paraliomyxa miuraensis]
MPAGPRVVHDDEQLQIVIWDRVVTSRWRGAPTEDALRILGEHQRTLTDSFDERRIVALTIVGPRATMLLSGEARKEAEVQAKVGRETLIALALVVEGEGFIAATARAVISGVQLAVRNPYPTKVFAIVDDARLWIEERLRAEGHVATAAGLHGAFDAGLGGQD